MQVVCGKCQKILDYASEPPRFCSNCGQALSSTQFGSTVEYDPEAVTLPPQFDPNAATLPPGPPPSSGALRRGRDQVGGYKLLRPLGAGGMGSVYEAESPSGQHVAIKLVAQEYGTSRDTIERFRQEGRLASAVAHPRCVFVLAADEDRGQPYIVMELMEGATLNDLVRDKGPLAIDDALRKILDVIEGLQEAHKREVIHRDVKPSNCFLEPDGRVKVGDFGLAKSLVSRPSAQLTKTGTFLGTPHYASPEQVRGETLDAQTDVYSVAATLFFLLTGRPPHQGPDAAATLARIVSDPAPSMRTIRPELPGALDRVVLKGLERDKKKRYQNLEEFRAALRAFLPGQTSIGSVGMRVGAYVIDWILLMPFFAVANVLVNQYQENLGVWTGLLLRHVPPAIAFLAYFGLSEGIWAASLGKRLLRLRVYTMAGAERPGLARGFLRILTLMAFTQIGRAGAVIYLGVLETQNPELIGDLPSDLAIFLRLIEILGYALGLVLLCSTMRAGNGYRGLHELVSGTRVIQQPWERQRRAPISFQGWLLYLKRSQRLASGSSGSNRGEGVPEQVGGFAVRGALRVAGEEKLLYGEDTSLGRKAIVWLRPQDAGPIPEARRNLGRLTRLRWLATGKERNQQWDAFLAPQGCPLPELIASERTLGWSDVRPILEDLANELAAGCADGTLPDQLTPDQVWVHTNGQVQLTDAPLTAAATAPDETEDRSPDARALALLRQCMELTLEGRRRDSREPKSPYRAPLPDHAVGILSRLAGVERPYAKVSELRDDLLATENLPTEINASLRGAHLGVLTAFLLPGLLFMGLTPLVLAEFLSEESTSPSEFARMALLFASLPPLFWVLWAFLLRGGLSYRLLGIAIVRGDGRPATRLQCAWRSLLCWTPPMVLLLLSPWLANWIPASNQAWSFTYAYYYCFAGVVGIFVLYALEAVVNPSRGLHDRLAGTHLVPR